MHSSTPAGWLHPSARSRSAAKCVKMEDHFLLIAMSLSSFGYCPTHLGAVGHPDPMREKDMRQVFKSLQSGHVQPEIVFLERLKALSRRAIDARHGALSQQFHQKLRATPSRAGESIATLQERVHLEILLPDTTKLAAPASFAQPESSAARIDRFLTRRLRHSWNRETRKRRSLIDDSLLLSMLSRVAPENAAQVLDFGLLLSALAWDVAAVEAFMKLGADPLRPTLDGGPLESQKRLPLAGAILMRDPANPTAAFASFRAASDETLLGALVLAHACVDPDDARRLGDIPAAKGRPNAQPPRAPDAFALAWRHQFVHCARFLAPLSASPQASIAWAAGAPEIPGRANDGPRQTALHELAARIEASQIHDALGSAPEAASRSPRL